MQNHLDSSQRTFSSMLQSDPFGPPSHDFSLSNHNSGSPGSDFGHLLNSSNHNHSTAINNNHLHHNNNNHSGNNNSGGVGGGGGETKPKKAPPPNGKKTKGRVKIKMEFIDNKLRRYTTFSKRKTGIMKKAYELSTLTGTQVMLLVASETGHVYTFATRKLQPMITSEAGKALIQTCLNSPDPPNSGSDAQRMSATGYEETELTYAADPNASDHGDVKDDDSETGSSDGDDPKEIPPLLPLSISNGLLPSNFAALVAGLGGTKGGLTIDSLVGSGRLGSSSSSSATAAAAAAQFLGQSIVTSTPSSSAAASLSPSSFSTSTNSTTTTSSSSSSSSSANHHNSSTSNSKSHYKIKREVVK